MCNLVRRHSSQHDGMVDAMTSSAYMTAYVKARRDKWIQENGPCQECGSTENLQVDHIDRTTKTIHTGHIWTRKKIYRDKELAKCQVLCIDCHDKKTGRENTTWQHGTISGYMRYKCKCIECRRAYRVYRHERYIKTGT